MLPITKDQWVVCKRKNCFFALKGFNAFTLSKHLINWHNFPKTAFTTYSEQLLLRHYDVLDREELFHRINTVNIAVKVL